MSRSGHESRGCILDRRRDSTNRNGCSQIGDDMSAREEELRLEGIVHAYRYSSGVRGKPFLGSILECSDGMEWVLDYDEQSPFHSFADRQVVVSGKPYEPEQSAQVIVGSGGQKHGHFLVSTMRLVEVTPDAELVEVGPRQDLCGQFELGASDTGESALSFVTEQGDAFLVANDPAGASVGRRTEVRAYPVQRSPSIPGHPAQYLWIICPYSAADLWEWRGRRSMTTGDV